jgi:beta-glucosidase
MHQQHSAVVQPIKSLRAFERVTLQPGETTRVQFTLPASQLAYWDVHAGKFAVEPGLFDVMVGSSSEDIRLRDRLVVLKQTK